MKKKIELSVETARSLYKTATPELKVILEENFDKKDLSNKITDRIKTLDDVRRKLVLTDLSTKQALSRRAFASLQEIAQALNEGWEPDFNNTDEGKWYPLFAKAESGWVFYCSYVHYSTSKVGFGSCFRSKELSDYAAAQFFDVYLDYLPE